MLKHMMVSNSGVTVSKKKAIIFLLDLFTHQSTHQATHRSQGHNLRQRTGCCWETWVQSSEKIINTFIKLKLFMMMYKICNNKIRGKQSMAKPTSPSLPRVPGSRGPSVNGKHLRGFRRLKFMRPIPNCPNI